MYSYPLEIFSLLFALIGFVAFSNAVLMYVYDVQFFETVYVPAQEFIDSIAEREIGELLDAK